jgi:hypothetical protein
MAQHYSYQDPDRTALKQGDVLQRTEELVTLLDSVHPHYGQHEQYQYFMVLTQTCDLVRRSGALPKSRYITLAAVRPIEEVLRRTAAELQEGWQRETSVISASARDKLKLFLERLVDTNEPGYFYLHPDTNFGLAQRYCAFLALSIALRRDHYDMCLRAKLFELKEPFQAKLGWLIGDMYGRVAVAEWDEEIKNPSLDSEIATLLRTTFLMFDDEKIREATEELKQTEGGLDAKTPSEIADFVKRKKLIPRKRRLLERATQVLLSSKIVEQFRERINTAIKQDAQLIDEIKSKLAADRDSAPDMLAAELVAMVRTSLRRSVTDANLPGREKLIKQLVGDIMEDAVVDKIVRD